jgi:hypothetical protein
MEETIKELVEVAEKIEAAAVKSRPTFGECLASKSKK